MAANFKPLYEIKALQSVRPSRHCKQLNKISQTIKNKKNGKSRNKRQGGIFNRVN